MLNKSDNIESWNDRPKHPNTVNGTNKYLINGEMIARIRNGEKIRN